VRLSLNLANLPRRLQNKVALITGSGHVIVRATILFAVQPKSGYNSLRKKRENKRRFAPIGALDSF
jgi:hypothetical protein